jgi:hypothetical protein
MTGMSISSKHKLSMKSTERRHSIGRHSDNTQVCLHADGESAERCKVGDISSAGMFIVTAWEGGTR